MRNRILSVLCITTTIIVFFTGCVKLDKTPLSQQNIESSFIEVLRVNSYTNNCKQDKYVYRTGKGLYVYDLSREMEEPLGIVGNGISDFAWNDEWIYYAIDYDSNQEIRRKNFYSNIDELIISNEEIVASNGDISATYILLDLIDNMLIWTVVNGESKVFISDISDAGKVETSPLVMTGDQSGSLQITEKYGLKVESFYEKDTKGEGYFAVKSIRDKETGLELLYQHDEVCVEVGEKEYLLYKEDDRYGNICMRENGASAVNTVTCLENDVYEQSNIYRSKIVVEGVDIVGQIPVVTDWRYAYDPTQDRIINDILFRLNLETRESKIIFETRDSDTRIIGYENGTVYLYKDYTVISQKLDGTDYAMLFTLEKGYDYTFDWQAGYMIVIRYDSDEVLKQIAKVYKVE